MMIRKEILKDDDDEQYNEDLFELKDPISVNVGSGKNAQQQLPEGKTSANKTPGKTDKFLNQHLVSRTTNQK